MLKRVMSALGALALCATAASAQVGSTTDLVVGRIVGPDTLPLRGAHVAVTSLESGITRTVTSDDQGHYSVVFPDGGGRYVVTVQYLGMFPMRTLVARQADEDRLVANVRMAAAAVVLSAIRVRAEQGDTLAGGAGAAGANVSRELLDRLGFLNDDATALAMITPGVSVIPGGDSSLASLSIGGMAPSQTAHTVDGVSGGGGALPREAVRNTNVVTSAYDVSAGRFTGGFIDQQTISGTNILRAGVNSSTPLAPIGGGIGDGVLMQRMAGLDVGANVAGPLRKDHLFYAAAFHASRMNMPGTSALTLDPAALGRLGVAPDSLSRFLNILEQHGALTHGGPLAPATEFGNHGGFARLDFAPNEHNTLTLSVNQNANHSRGSFGGYLATPGAGGEWRMQGGRAYVALTSHWGNWVNDARVSAAREQFNNGATLPAASGHVVVSSARTSTGDTPSISTFSFGGYGSTDVQRSTSFEVKNEVSRMSEDGAHRVKLGLDALATHATGGLPNNLRGTYTFNSLADLDAGRAMSYHRAIVSADRRSGVIDLAGYLGDAWRVGPQLQLVYGARIEQSRFTNPPAFNPTASAAFGIRTDRFPHETAVTPRLGFTLLPGASGKGPPLFTLRGGVGMFRSGGDELSQVLASARDATGLPGSVVQLSCVGADVPPVNWSAFTDPGVDAPTACANGSAGAGAVSALPSVMLIDPSLRVPTALRASLTLSRSLRKIWNVSLDASLTNESNNTGVRDINLVAAPSFTIANEDGRPVYASPSAIVPSTGAIALADSRADPRWGVVGLASPSLQSRDRSLTLSVGRMGQKLSVNASYTREWSRMQVLPALPGLVSFFGSAVAGDPRIPQWVDTPWGARHSVRFSMTLTPKPWMQITPSLYGRAGSRFSPMVTGDVNGDGAADDLAFIFDPAHTADTAVANGMQRLLASAPRRVRDCLSPHLGHMGAAFSCSVPWYLNGGLSVRLTPPWQGKRLTLSLQTNSLLSGADLLLHGPAHLHGWGQFFGGDNRLLYVRGFDPATHEYRYAVNERFGVARQSQVPSFRPFQLMLAAQLNLGPTSSGPPGMAMLPGMAKGAPGGALSSADTLRARVARTLPNRFRRTLALNDSLALHLDTAQTTRLKTLGDAFQPRADSLTGRIVTAMRAPLTTTTASDVAAHVRAETEAGRALEVQAVADLRSILRPDQLAKLPAELTRAP